MNFKSEITKLHYDKNAKNLLLDILEFFSIFYGVITKTRNFFYDKGILKTYKVNAKVISIGNMTTGGVGKTPVALSIAKYYRDKGEKVAVITRGYGGELSNKKVNLISNGADLFYNSKEAGDEAYLLATQLSECAVLTSKDRVKAAQYAINELDATVIILDDAFQYRRIHRDKNILLVDSEMMFGNEKLLPAGPLREGLEGFNRVNKLLIMNKSSDATRANKIAKIMGKKFKCNSFVCSAVPDKIYNIKTGDSLATGETVTMLCAIGQPKQFLNFIQQDFEVIDQRIFDDHHAYIKSDISDIKGNILTTEKDAVKLAKFDMDNIFALKLKTEFDIDGLLADE